ncbi:HNH endonuclease [Streptomyces sp. 891-h]|uniref:HNH endonuclease n=1 Tax=Streptomyces sp. 891-h TaxID=2720714 RepID=UPI001FA9D9FF|nr:HNH endonuclease [Streptomyces sp. 891-h]UNZ20621.1 hypothetical protein HC362_29705 [Streptomyces sp. 891-h]
MHYYEAVPRGDKYRKLTPTQIEEIVSRYTTRLPDGTWEGTSTLAREFDVSPTTINRWLRIHGVDVRSASESHSGGKRCKPVKNLPYGDPPGCGCGCGKSTAWNRRKNRWNRYVVGHYRRPALYKQDAWLRAEYVDKRRTAAELATECEVSKSTILKFMNQFEISRRNLSESRMGRHVGTLNPAWRGGVADWPYSPDWKVLARRIRDEAIWTCQDCGATRKRWGNQLHVHHIDGNKLNNERHNLVAICAPCHRERHRQMNLPLV